MPLPKAKLSKFFKSFAPLYVLGTTYTVSFAFFESVVFPLIDRKKLRRCVLLCDQHGFQRARAEAFALRGATREYMAVTVPCRGSFHPKVWLLVGEQKLALLVGSGNLTQSGFINNLELFDVVELQHDGDGRELAEDVSRFLDGLVSRWPDSDSPLLVVEAIEEIRSAVEMLAASMKPGSRDTRLVTSFDGPLDEVMVNRMDDESAGSDGDIRELHVAAPYFGGSSAGIERLRATLEPEQTVVYPALHDGGLVDLPGDFVAAHSSSSGDSGLRLATSSALSKKNRFSHLKLFGILRGGQHWLANGSFNGTVAAIAGDNIEAVLLRRVSGETFDNYFAADAAKDLEAAGQVESEYERSDWWLFWATDQGDRIKLVTDRKNRLPLRNVRVELRAGGHRSVHSVDELFNEQGLATIPWSVFDVAKKNASAARLIQIEATDGDGKAVVGAALVDDVAALSADPSHRGAWRAAVALLSGDGMPQYSDIAALFSLVQDVAWDDDEEDETEVRRVAGSTATNRQDKAAVWPPEPIEAMAGSLSGLGLAGGGLHWFDRILSSLVRRQDETEEIKSVDGDDGEDVEGESIELAVDKKVIRGCERVWKHAFDQFCRLENELSWMEIDSRQAPRLWGPVTFMFLGTLAVRRSIVSVVGDDVETFPLTELLRDSALMMFGDRDQGDDFSPKTSCCYDDMMFPAVASDLADRFNTFPHPEVCSVWLLTMAHLDAVQRKTGHADFVLSTWLCLKQVAGDHLALCGQDEDHLRNLWDRYFGGGVEGLAWADIQRSLDAIQKLTWHDHDGFAELWSQRDVVADGRFEVADDTSGACLHDRCRLNGQVDPVNARKLKELHIAKCAACGTIMVPARLDDAFRQELKRRTEANGE